MALQRFIPFCFLLLSLSSCGQGVTTVDARVADNTIPVPVDTAPRKLRNFARFEKEILKFEEYDRAGMPAAGGILFVGSSSVRLWKTVAQDMAPLPVVNRGFGGATIGEINYYFRRIVAKYKPRLLVFYAGENDLFNPDTPVDSVVNDFNRFRDSMDVYLPQCRMFFIGVKPSPARWEFEDKFLEANLCFQEICSKDPRWDYLDVTAPMLDATGRPRKEIYRADSLHMNSTGYAEWTHIVKPALRTAWKTASQTVPKAP